MYYKDRRDAGNQLAAIIRKKPPPVWHQVIAVPRGGVEVAVPIVRALGCPLSLITPRKIAAPGQPEFAVGAVGPDGSLMLNPAVVADLQISPEYIEQESRRQLAEISRRQKNYPAPVDLNRLTGQNIILVDDGIATGYTLMAALKTIRNHHPACLLIALPVGPPEVVAKLRQAGKVICPHTPEPFFAVGMYYEEFAQTTDQEVCTLVTTVNAVYGPNPTNGRLNQPSGPPPRADLQDREPE
ncbi:MAG: phosphoribosyltransferase family protein [Heliobacteriaceae bacterium]|nr:phosphoribosyltransferase family protein [Heliobacteriaceae bacterium]MDD4588095.1 phosphoribosyltransferase family protein [Heliobacteriaceae bacterium]